MKKILFLLYFVTLSFVASAQNWVRQMGNSNSQYGEAIAIDASGNSYTTGSFQGTVDFDPSAAIFELTAQSSDIFVVKLDINGDFVWAKKLGGTSGDEGTSIKLDAIGNIYVSGGFNGTADFDPSATTFNLTSAGQRDFFIVKLDANGNLVWAKRVGGTSIDNCGAIALDGTGNIYATGYFNLTVDFNPGTGTFNLTSAGSADIFLLKLDNNGNFVWANRMGSTEGDFASDITVGASGNPHITGSYRTTVDFDPSAGIANLTSMGEGDIYIAKYTLAGALDWAKSIGSTSYDDGNSLTTDALENVYVAGDFSATADFDPGVGVFSVVPEESGSNGFVVKLNSTGNFSWASQFSGPFGGTSGNSIALDATMNSYVVGSAFDGVDNSLIIIVKLDANGNLVVNDTANGSGSGSELAVDAVGTVYATGRFEGTVDFTLLDCLGSLSGGTSADVFILKTSASGSATITSFTPTTATVGSPVVITGTGFSATPSDNGVYFGGEPAIVTASTTTTITTSVPVNAVTGRISVSVGCGSALSITDFIVDCGPIPTITSFSPTTGTLGTAVEITGTNFSTTPSDNIIDFGGYSAVVTASTSTTITTSVPTGPAGLVPITITIACNTVTSSTNFDVTCPPSPTITSFTPITGAVGAVVTISGTNFSTNPLENLVDFNGEPSIVTGSTATTITTTVPANAITGLINVFVGCDFASSPTDFVVTNVCNPTTGSINNTFIPPANSNGNSSPVDDIIIQPDGKILVNFFETGGIEYNMCRLLADGTLDPAFTQWNRSLFNGRGDLIALQTDGKILLGGRFTEINVTNYGRIVRFNSDGSIDGTFNASASGFDDQVRAIIIQPDGKIIVGGSFTSYNGSPANSIIRINADGAIDAGFSFGSGFNGEVRSIIQQTDGKILLGGFFTAYNSTAVQSIVRLNGNGTLDLSFTPPALTSISEIALQSDNKIVLYGATGLIRLNQNGTQDGTFDTGSGFDDDVTTVYCEPSGKIIVGGYFQNINGKNKNFIARLNPNGSVDNFFDVGVGSNSWIFDIVPAGTNNFLVAGYFDLWNNQPQNGIALLNIACVPTPFGIDNSSCGPSITISACGGINGQYRWYTTASGGSPIAGETNASLSLANIITTTTYYVALNDGVCESARIPVIATIIPSGSSAPTTTGNSICTVGSLVLTASGGTNGQYRWYTAATGGTPIAGEVNSNYTTPSLSATTTYYVAINNGTCESARTSVTATINTTPTAPSGTDGSGCLPSASITLNASGGTNGQYRWYSVATGGTAINGETNSSLATPALSATTTYYVSINNGTCESGRTSVVAALLSCTTPPTITAAPLSTSIGGIAELNLVPLIATFNNPLNISSITVITQPPSGAFASILNGKLIVNYAGISFSGIEQVTVRACDSNGNCANQVFEIEVAGDVIVFNALSPNGANPSFVIQYIEIIPETKNNTVTIFDRWQNEVWKKSNYNNSSVVFAGISDSGSDLPTGIYFYKIEFASGRKTQTGFISLKR